MSTDNTVIEQLCEVIQNYQTRADKAEAERDELRDVLRDLLTLRQAELDGVSGQFHNFVARERAVWKLAAELTHFEEGP